MGRRVGPTRIPVKGVVTTLAPVTETEVDLMKKVMLLVLVVCVVLLIAGPVYADSDHANHPDHCPGVGAPHNHPIPPGYAGADAPGPIGPGP